MRKHQTNSDWIMEIIMKVLKKFKDGTTSQVRRQTRVIPALRRQTQEDCCKFEASLVYTVIGKNSLGLDPVLRLAWPIQ